MIYFRICGLLIWARLAKFWIWKSCFMLKDEHGFFADLFHGFWHTIKHKIHYQNVSLVTDSEVNILIQCIVYNKAESRIFNEEDCWGFRKTKKQKRFFQHIPVYQHFACIIGPENIFLIGIREFYLPWIFLIHVWIFFFMLFISKHMKMWFFFLVCKTKCCWD